jgi:hypothetical protein
MEVGGRAGPQTTTASSSSSSSAMLLYNLPLLSALLSFALAQFLKLFTTWSFSFPSPSFLFIKRTHLNFIWFFSSYFVLLKIKGSKFFNIKISLFNISLLLSGFYFSLHATHRRDCTIHFCNGRDKRIWTCINMTLSYGCN